MKANLLFCIAGFVMFGLAIFLGSMFFHGVAIAYFSASVALSLKVGVEC